MNKTFVHAITVLGFLAVLAGCSSWMSDKRPTSPPVDPSLPGVEAASSSAASSSM